MDLWEDQIWHTFDLLISILKGEPIKIFNNGDFEHDLYRDFAYVDDIVEGIERFISNPSNEAFLTGYLILVTIVLKNL
jgi:nucleoside-diphosphate-sugar epimerase